MENELSLMIRETCRCSEIQDTDISPDSPLIGPDSPFGLDSLDAVEIVVAVQRRYGVRIDSQETSRKVLQSLRTLGDYIRSRRK